MSRSRQFHLLIAFVFCCSSAFAQLHPNVFYLYEDSSKTLTATTALHLYKEGKFSKPLDTSINKGFTRSVFWLAYSNTHTYPSDSLLLYIGHQHINRIHFFNASDSSLTQQWLTGDYYPFAQRPVKATGFYFPIHQQGIYLARIDKSNESLQLSFHLVSRVAALSAEAENKSMLFLFTGMIMLMVIFGIYLFLISTKRLYLWFILYISTGWLWVLANAGYGFEYLWPNLPWFASKARPVFAIAPLFFSMLFLPKYIGGISDKRIKRLIISMNALLLGCIITILLFNEKGYQTNWWVYIQYVIPLLVLVYVLIILGVLLWYSFKGNKLAVFYLVAIVVLLISVIVQVSFAIGSLNTFHVFFNTYGMAAGYVTESIILTAGLVYRFNQYRMDKETLLKDINKQQAENTKILMEVQEAERSQIANQLHDVAGSLLSAARLNLSSLKENKEHFTEADANRLEKAEEAVMQVGDMVRNLSHALSPVMMEQVGFKTALEKVIAIFNTAGKMNIELLVMGFEKYEPELNNYYTALYSIVYELLNNIVKHSGARHALIQVTENSDSFTMIAEDDGAGFDQQHLSSKQSLGIAGIQSKITYFKGSVAFDKNEPQGLIVTIEIPISYGEK